MRRRSSEGGAGASRAPAESQQSTRPGQGSVLEGHNFGCCIERGITGVTASCECTSSRDLVVVIVCASATLDLMHCWWWVMHPSELNDAEHAMSVSILPILNAVRPQEVVQTFDSDACMHVGLRSGRCQALCHSAATPGMMPDGTAGYNRPLAMSPLQCDSLA